MNKFCAKCGSKIAEKSNFCPSCGEKVENSNSSDGKKKILPFVIGGGIAVFVLVIGVFIVTGFGGNNQEKIKKTLQDQGYTCKSDSENTVCEKEENNKKRIFELGESSVDYEEIIYDSGIVRVTIDIDKTNYDENYEASAGIVYANFHGEDAMEFFPEHCTDRLGCHLRVGEKVYPALKEEYDEYREYFASGKDKEYLRASSKGELSLSEEIRQETIFEKNSVIRDHDKFTENVNDALRYYEKIFADAGVSLEKN